MTRLTLQNERWRTANEARLPRSSRFSFDIHTNVYARESLEAVPRFMHSDWSGNASDFLSALGGVAEDAFHLSATPSRNRRYLCAP